MTGNFGRILSVIAIVSASTLSAYAQQVTTHGTSLENSAGFHESFQTAWGIRGPNFFANFGPPTGQPLWTCNGPPGGIASIIPPASTPWQGYFAFGASQSYAASNNMQSPVVTGMQGYPSYVLDITQSPFVTSVVPVVGAAGGHVRPVPPPTVERLAVESKATAPPPTSPTTTNSGMTVAEARLVHEREAHERDAAARKYLDQGDEALEAGKPAVAKIFYRMALTRADGELASIAQDKLSRLARTSGISP